MSDDEQKVVTEADIDDGWEADELEPSPQAEPATGATAEPPTETGEEPRGGRSRSRRRSRGDDRPESPPDERAEQAMKFVGDVLDQMGMDCRVRLRRPSPDNTENPPEIVVEITGRDSGRIIGKKGLVLGAIQFLTHRAINRPQLERRHVLVDADGYRLRREASLATMAKRLGKQAVDEGKIITFEPMNPRDRRVVHLALAKFEGLITKSDGEGDSRRVQIIPVRR